jgi:hypothetical protein
MSDETLQLLKAFIDAAGYDVKENGVCNLNRYEVTKKPPKPRKEAKAEGYTEHFMKLWSKYPKGHSGSKAATYRQYRARLEQHDHSGDEFSLMFQGLDRYIKYIEATRYSVKSSETFFGRDRHYTSPFEITDRLKKQNRVKQPWEFIPENDNKWDQFIKDHGFKKPDRMATTDQVKRDLQKQIRARIEAECNPPTLRR